VVTIWDQLSILGTNFTLMSAAVCLPALLSFHSHAIALTSLNPSVVLSTIAQCNFNHDSS
jgi:hypothetical protein